MPLVLVVDDCLDNSQQYVLEEFIRLWRIHPGVAFRLDRVFSDERLIHVARSLAVEGMLSRVNRDYYCLSPRALELLRLGDKYSGNVMFVDRTDIVKDDIISEELAHSQQDGVPKERS